MEKSYMFQTLQSVPQRVINKIGQDILTNFEIRLKGHSIDITEKRDILMDLQMAVDQVASEHAPSVDGYRLTDKQVIVIGDLIRMGKPIGAIKEFRYATGEGLRESKNFIDKFTKGRSFEEAFIHFTNAFSG
jgi:ribosomal protein L7/L12